MALRALNGKAEPYRTSGGIAASDTEFFERPGQGNQGRKTQGRIQSKAGLIGAKLYNVGILDLVKRVSL